MISVCVPTYNGEKYIYEQLLSILSQINYEDEILISDDGSTDNTLDIIQSINDRRIKIYHHKDCYKSKNKFNLTTRNIQNALSKAQGDYIFLADQDDIWAANKIEVCLQALIKNDVVLHDCSIVDKYGKLIEVSYFKYNSSKPGILKNIIKNSYLGCCMAFNKKMMRFFLPFPDEVPHDIWIGLIGERVGKILFINEQLVYYRRHGSNLSASGEKSSNTLLFKIKYRAIILREFINRSLQLKIHNR